MNKKGSITLETAISFSAALILIVSIVNCICVYRTDILMQRSVSESCEKFALFAPLSITGSDMIYTMVNALPDPEEGGTHVTEMIADTTGIIAGLDGSTGHNITELILDGSFGRLMRDDIAAGYARRNGGSSFGGPESIGVDYEISDDHSIIEVTVTYKVLTILGMRTRSIYSVIPIYGEWNFMFNEDTDTEEEDGIWQESNFTRGDLFRERYGADLPSTFPVIDSYEDGIARSITSIDLTSPWYIADNGNLTERIEHEIDLLAGFDGCDVNIEGQNYSIASGDITGRILTVIIPENSGENEVDRVTELIPYASSAGVDVELIRDGVSERYLQGSDSSGDTR